MVIQGYFYMGMSLFSLHGCNLFCVRAVFSMDAYPPLSSVNVGHYCALIGGVTVVAVTIDCPRY